MGFIQNFKNFFNDKVASKKSTSVLTKEDAEYITERLKDFADEFFMDDHFIELDIKRDDINFTTEFINPGRIELGIKINNNISIKGRGGRIVVRELMCDIANSNLYQSFKKSLSKDYNITDLSDIEPDAFNKGFYNTFKAKNFDTYRTLIKIVDLGILGLIVKPK